MMLLARLSGTQKRAREACGGGLKSLKTNNLKEIVPNKANSVHALARKLIGDMVATDFMDRVGLDFVAPLLISF